MIIYNRYHKRAQRRAIRAKLLQQDASIQEEGMKALICLILWIGLLVSGCASGGYYASPSSNAGYYGGYYGYGSYGNPYNTNVPPEFYDYDPSLSHWYTYPYWNPDRD
jgi:hypothetical protein